MNVRRVYCSYKFLLIIYTITTILLHQGATPYSALDNAKCNTNWEGGRCKCSADEIYCWFRDKSGSVHFQLNSSHNFIKIICLGKPSDINKSLEQVPKFEMPTRVKFRIGNCHQLPDILKQKDVVYDADIDVTESTPINLLHNSSGIENLTVESSLPISPIFFLHLKSLRTLTFQMSQSYSGSDRPVYCTAEHFQNLTALKNLTITATFFISFPENIFSSLGELEDLSLQNNELSELQENSFAAQKKLIGLDLSKNHIKYLPEKLFKNTRSLRFLNLSGNFFSNPSIIIACTKPLRFLHQLDLSHNQLRTIAGNDSYANETLLTNFEQLEDFSSQISNTDYSDINGRHHFIWLDLSFNSIEIFNTNWYNKIRTQFPIITSLSNNQKEHRYLALSLFDENSPYTRKIYLAGEPQECYESLYNVTYFQANILAATDACHWFPDSGKCEYVWDDEMLYIDCSSRNMTEFTPLVGPTHFGVKYANLDISHNQLRELPAATTIAYLNVIQLNASHNQLTVIRPTQLPSNLRVLDVSNNNLTYLSADCFDLYQSLTHFYLSGNPWGCDCDAEPLLLAVKAFRSHIRDVDKLHCDNEPARGILNLTFTEICPQQKSISMPVYIGLSSTAIVALIIIGFSLKYSLHLRIWLHSHNICRRFINEHELYKNKNFDAFISYAYQDEQFVNKTLLPGLEEGPIPFRICTHERNWLAGAYIPEQIIESVEQSSRTIIVLSQHFIESDWARMEFRMAHQSSLIEGRSRLVIIKYGEIVKNSLLDRELRAYLSTTTYLDWNDERFWHKLRYAMPHKKGEARDAGMLETGRRYVIGEVELRGPCRARN